VTVEALVKEAGMDTDEALIALWDAGLSYVNGPDDVLPRGEANRARRALGLATRRELASADFWQDTLSLGRSELDSLLAVLGVDNAYDGQRLRKRAINRLKGEGRKQGVWPPHAPLGDQRAATTTESLPVTWELIGHERELRYLTPQQVETIHEALVNDFADDPDPIVPSGVKSQDLLASATHRPRTAMDGILKYPTIEMAAAALLHAVVHDHAFHNGNKRTALVSMLVFLDENGLVLTCDQDPLFKLVLQLAQHALANGPAADLADREVLAVARWLREHSRWVEKGDRALPWRRLQRILASYSCEFEFPGGVGNRINISRKVFRKGSFFSRGRYETLSTQIYYGGQGREIEKNALNKLRHDLELDDDNGIDSGSFYDNAPAAASDFIVRYRKTIRRLARL
jgi:death-on-curing family protein